MKPNKEFFKTILKSFNPEKYSELVNNKDNLSYLALLVLVVYLVMIIISSPKIFTLKSYLNEQFSKFEKLDISIDLKTKEPIVLTKNNPQIRIDSSIENITFNEERIIIDDDKMLFKPFMDVKVYNGSQFKNLLEKKKEANNFLLLLIILVLPTLLVISYILHVVKYLAIIFLFSIISFIVLFILKKDASFARLVKLSFYAITPMIIIEILAMPYGMTTYLFRIPSFVGFDLYLVPLSIFIIYSVLGMHLVFRQTNSKRF